MVALDADFLTCGPGSVRYSKDFASRRRITDDNKVMNRLYAIESTPSLTGAKADHRLGVAAAEVETIARQIAAALGANVPGAAAGAGAGESRPATPDVGRWVAAIVKDLQAHKGRSVVVAGEYQTAAVSTIARAINDALGNSGTTVTYGASIEASGPAASSIADLAQAMDAGQVELLVIMGGNPVFTAPVDLRFSDRLGKVGLSVYYGDYVDETAAYRHWNVPATHPLESWDDSRAFDGTVTLTQPLIAPLYEGRSAHEFLNVFTSQGERRALAIVKDFWTKAYSSGQGGWTFKHPRDGSFPNADAVLADRPARRVHRRHRGDGRRTGHVAADACAGRARRSLCGSGRGGTRGSSCRARRRSTGGCGRCSRIDSTRAASGATTGTGCDESATTRPAAGDSAAARAARERCGARADLPPGSRRCGTAVSRTTAGCRSCRSRSRK